MGVVGKGIMVSLFCSATALTQASPVAGQMQYVDDNCGSSGSSARHAGSRGGCMVQLGDSFSVSPSAEYIVQANFIAPPNFSGAISSTAAQAANAVPVVTAPVLAPPAVAPGPAAIVPVVAQAIAPQPIVVAAPTVTPTNPTQPVGSAAPPGDNPSPVATPSVLSVPEPSTLVLLLGGFLALVGVRRSRAANNK